MMLTVDALFVEIRGLRRPDLDRWISNAWVRTAIRSIICSAKSTWRGSG